MNFVTKILVLANWDPSNIEEGSQIYGKVCQSNIWWLNSYHIYPSSLLVHFYFLIFMIKNKIKENHNKILIITNLNHLKSILNFHYKKKKSILTFCL